MIPSNPKHHYYGHVQDLEGYDTTSFFLLPFQVLLVLFLIATGLWPILLLFWLLGTKK